MQTSVPTDKKKIVLSVWMMASRLFGVRRATWMPSTMAKASSTSERRQHAQQRRRVHRPPPAPGAPRRRRQAAVPAVDARQQQRRQQIFLGVVDRCRRSLPKMNSFGVRSVTSSRSRAPGVALGGDGRRRLGRHQQQAQHADRHQAVGGGEGGTCSLRSSSGRQGGVADQRQHDEVGRLDQQRPAAVGAREDLAPEDRVGADRRDLPGGGVGAGAGLRPSSSRRPCPRSSSGCSRCMIGSPLGFHTRSRSTPQPLSRTLQQRPSPAAKP